MSGVFNGLYLGGFEHTLDPQGRLTLPSEWRDSSGDTVLIMIPARGKALLFFPEITFRDFLDRARRLAIANPKLQSALAYLGYYSRVCKCDKQGRLALDKKMLDTVGIADKVTLVGAFSHIRMSAPGEWNPPAPSEVLDNLSEIQQLAEHEPALSEILGGALKK